MLIDEAPEHWAEELMKGAELGDARRNKSAAAVLATMGHHAGDSLPRMCQGEQALYTRMARFARNDHCTPEAILASGCERSAMDVASHPGVILVVSDTTSLSWPHESVAETLGYTTGGERGAKGQGALAHSAIAISGETYEVLGLIDQMYGIRELAHYGIRTQRKERPYEEKESFKWEASLERCIERLFSELKRCVFINDREADVYEYLMTLCDWETRFIIRATQNRVLETSEYHLHEEVKRSPLRAMATVVVPQKGGREERKARLEVRACPITLKGPHRAEYLPSLALHAVSLVEIAPPEGVEAIQWLLLTREPIETLADLERIVRWYACRWGVEEFHKCWKSEGTKVEELRLQCAENLLRMAVLMALTAIRLLRLRTSLTGEEMVRRAPVIDSIPPQAPKPDAQAESPCTKVLTTLQWQVLWLSCQPQEPLPKTPPSRQWAMCAVAKLGGWLDTKRTGRPGYGTLWKGWKRLEERVEASLLARLLEQTVQEKM